MARTRANTGLIAFLTVTFMLLAVAVVTVVTLATAKRDPEEYAALARRLEAQGDIERAATQWRQAYTVNRESKYLVEAARVVFHAGDVRNALGMLQQEHARVPGEELVIDAVLEHLWTLRQNNAVGSARARMMRDYSDARLEQDPNNVLALLSRYQALTLLREDDPAYADLADQAFEKAIEVAPENPRVAHVRALRIMSQPLTDVSPSSVYETLKQQHEDAVAALDVALAEHPDDPLLARTYANVVAGDPRVEMVLGSRRYAEYDFAALRDLQRAYEVLHSAVEANPDDTDLLLLFGQMTANRVREADESLTTAQREALVAEAREKLMHARELEPALYPAYNELARLELVRTSTEPATPEERRQRFEAALAAYDKAIGMTGTNLQSLRALLRQDQRMEMIQDAYDTAVAYYQRAADDAQRETALDYAKRFSQAAANSYANTPAAVQLQARTAVLENDTIGAIEHYTQLLDMLGGREGPAVDQIRRTANQQLAVLYARRDQYGRAKEYYDVAEELTLARMGGLPLDLGLLKADILANLGRDQEALDTLDGLAIDYPESGLLNEARAAALARLGRGTEAEEALATGDTQRAALLRAGVAMSEERWDQAQEILEELLAEDPLNRQVLQMLGQTMRQSGQQDEYVALLDEQIAATTDDDHQRYLRSLKVNMQVDDPEERRRQLRALIESNSDPIEREWELYLLAYTNNDTEAARASLEALEPLLRDLPDDASPPVTLNVVLDRQFALALATNELDRAADMVAELTERNVDRVEGARVRGMLALARGDGKTAVRELRAADRQLPDDADMKVQLARAHMAVDPPQQAEALAVLEEAVSINPRHPAANRMLFLMRVDNGMRDDDPEFRPLLTTALELNPGDPRLEDWADWLRERENPAAAIEIREAQRASNPDDVDNLMRLAQLYRTPQINDLDQAEAIYQEALAIVNEYDWSDPARRDEIRRVYQSAATLYEDRGRMEDALALLEQFADRSVGANRAIAQIIIGDFYENAGDLEKARAALMRAVELAGEVAVPAEEQRQLEIDTGVQLVNFLYRTGQIDDLLTNSRRLLDRLTDEETTLAQNIRLRMIDALLNSNRTADARPEVERYLADYPQDNRGRLVEARLLILEDKLVDAVDLLTRIIEEEPDNALARYMRGSVNSDLRRLPQAREDLLAAARLAPDSFNLGHRLRLAAVREMMGDVPLAESELTDLLDEHPDNRNVALSLISLLVRHDSVGEARDVAARFSARQPEDPFWPHQLGTLLMREGNPAAAISPLRRAGDLTQWRNLPVLIDYSRALVQAGRPSEVLNQIDQLPDPLDQHPLVMMLTASAHAALGNTAQRDETLRAGLQSAANASIQMLAASVGQVREFMSPEETIAIMNAVRETVDPAAATRIDIAMIDLHSTAQQFERAGQLADAAIAASEPGSVERLLALLGKAQVLEQRGSGFSPEVRELYEQVLEIDANNFIALNNLAYFLATTGAPREALQYANRLRTMRQDNGATWDTIGLVYMLNNRTEEARAALRQAITLDPENAPAHLHLGQLLKDSGNVSDARRMLGRAVELAQATGDQETLQDAEEALAQLP